MMGFLDFFYPARCPGCDGILETGEKKSGFCRKCAPKIRMVGDAQCLKCGRPLANAADEYCPDCAKKKHAFGQGKGVFCYEGPMKPAMYRFKYGNRRGYGRIFADVAARRYGAWLRRAGVDCIVPVPMFSRKKRLRGYNQAEAFARELGHILGVPVEARALRRVRMTLPQKGLNYAQRKYNLKNAFKLWKSSVKSKSILIVDDIYTTGSTMDEASRVLKGGGAGKIYCLSVCIGRGYQGGD